MEHVLSMEMIDQFIVYYREWDKAEATCTKYRRILLNLFVWTRGHNVTRELLNAYRQTLLTEKKYSPSTVNVCVAAINGLMRFL